MQTPPIQAHRIYSVVMGVISFFLSFFLFFFFVERDEMMLRWSS